MAKRLDLVRTAIVIVVVAVTTGAAPPPAVAGPAKRAPCAGRSDKTRDRQRDRSRPRRCRKSAPPRRAPAAGAALPTSSASIGAVPGAVASGGPLESPPPAGAGVAAAPRFSPSSFWNTRVSAGDPVDPASAAVVAGLVSQVQAEERAGTGPAINTTEYSVPIYTVPAEQPTVPVALESPYPAPALRSALSAVPLPPDARPATGRDAHLVLWQPSTDRLWEFWRLRGGIGEWEAEWAGAIEGVSSNPGVFGPDAWPGATNWWGASASGLALAGGLITFADLRRGEIDHALSMSTPEVRAGVYCAPARRTDGRSASPLALPEGAHLRLDPNLDLDGLNLPRLTRMLAEAAQRYGIYVRDTSANITFNAQDPTPTGSDPYRGPTGYFEGSYPRALLASFPWSSLELLEMETAPG